MALSVFLDKSAQPTEADLAKALKGSYLLWNELKKRIASQYTPLSFEWGYTSKTTGWGLRVKNKQRIIFYMTPCEGHFLASFALGEKAVAAARNIGLPDSIIRAIDSARKYAEGRGVRFKVTRASDVDHIEKLAALKMSN